MNIVRKCPICGAKIPIDAPSTKVYCSEHCARIAHRRSEYAKRDRAIRDNSISRRERYGLYITYAQECAICRFSLRTKRIITATLLAWYLGNDYARLLATQEQRVDARAALKQASGGCELHHIVPISEGGSPGVNNTILLCPNCHKKVHRGIISQQQLLDAKEEYNEDAIWRVVAFGLSTIQQI